LPPFNGAETPFSWTIVTGESGAGKTRLTVEAARELGQRKRFGGKASWKQNAQIATAWLREECPIVHRRTTDPWDTGFLPKGPLDQKTLRDWLPRRPTFLIADCLDPTIAASLINLLGDQASNYRKPVRLVVIGQTAPSELLFSKWQNGLPSSSNLPAFSPPPPLVDQAHSLSEHKGMRAFVAALTHGRPQRMVSNVSASLKRDEDFESLAKAAAGNPLLAEIAIDLIERGKALSELGDQRRILTERARTIIETLNAAGFHTPEYRRALAVATLADAPLWKNWSQILKYDVPSPTKILHAFPYSAEAHALSQWAESDATDGIESRLRIPALRPDLLGDRVLDLWINESGPGADFATAKEFVKLAWSVGPGVVRAARRRSHQKDPLALALQEPPSPDAFATAQAYAATMIDGAIRYGMAASSVRPAIENIPADALSDFAELLISATGAPEARFDVAFDAIALFCKKCEENTPTRVSDLVRAVTAAFSRASSDATNGNENLQTAQTIGDSIRTVWQKNNDIWSDRRLRQLILALSDRATDHGGVGAATMIPLLGVFDYTSMASDESIDLASAWEKISLSYAKRAEDNEAAFKAAERVEHIGVRFENVIAIQIQRAKAWGNLALGLSQLPAGTGVAAARNAIVKVETIAKRFPESQEMEEIKIWSWVQAARANSTVPHGLGGAATLKIARTIDEIAQASPSSIAIQEARATVWMLVASAFSLASDPVQQTIDAAERCDMIANGHQDNRSILEACAEAHQKVSTAFRHTPSRSSLAAARRVDRIAAKFGNDEVFQTIRAKSWLDVAHAQSRHVKGAGNALATTAAEIIDGVGKSFPSSRTIQILRAQGWAEASDLPTTHTLDETMRIAARLDKIAADFPDVSEIQESRAEVWRQVVRSESHRPFGHGIEAAEKTALAIKQLVAKFPESRKMAAAYAAAWRDIAYGHSEVLGGAHVDRILDAIEKIDHTISPFLPDNDLLSFKVGALQNLACAYSFCPHGEGAENAWKAAESIDSLENHLANNLYFEEYRARAWRHVARAFGTKPKGTGFRSASKAAARVSEIARRFPSNGEIQEQSIRAKNFE
jgi:hypothetical protein